ncbi:LysR substrate-binding domain-containing protein [Novosphingobium sediminicola]|uniref:DNA-binding transcriptional LysR family regulator n=1 Tax=Novosphingobium sediminicola TaxID=563162 RepID=A0A7W6G6F9_9SPHN|nr:LysR substrate-binding domain-containing protein [Novosphingobium sediminicola]MBB3955256.1 DNA-binding transcriptional LysR family regulator [Novosphingobium sediminicola]
MTLEQLRIFVAVAQSLNMTRAAQELNLTQPSVSAAMAALEGRHGLRLFDRVGRSIELSEAGRAFLPEARGVLARAREAAQALDDLAGLRRGSLRIAASQTVATYWLPARMARFAARHPGIALDLALGNTQESAEAVLAGEADLAFVEGEAQGDLLRVMPVGEDRLGLYARADHPLAGRALDHDALRGAAWVLREMGSGTRAHLGLALAQAGLDWGDLDIRLELPANGAVLEALAAGDLITAVSEYAAASRVAAGRVVRLDWPFAPRGFAMLSHRARRLSAASEAFVASLAGS